jgi:N-acyl-D-amino-acid deacylase
MGAATIRENVLGFADRAPTASELVRMQELARQTMKEGALALPPL